MRSLLIVKTKVAIQNSFQIPYTLVRMQIHLLVLHATPQPLDEHVVQRPATAVHADRDRMPLQPLRELPAADKPPRFPFSASNGSHDPCRSPKSRRISGSRKTDGPCQSRRSFASRRGFHPIRLAARSHNSTGSGATIRIAVQWAGRGDPVRSTDAVGQLISADFLYFQKYGKKSTSILRRPICSNRADSSGVSSFFRDRPS